MNVCELTPSLPLEKKKGINKNKTQSKTLEANIFAALFAALFNSFASLHLDSTLCASPCHSSYEVEEKHSRFLPSVPVGDFISERSCVA